MKTIPAALLTELQSTSPRISVLVKVQNTAGQAVYYTDHDLPIKIGSDEYFPGLTIASQTNKSSTSPTTQSQQLLLDNFFLTKADATDGAFDGAAVEVSIVSWANPTGGTLLLVKGTIGELLVGDTRVDAEIRSQSDKLRQTIIRTYGTACDVHVLGDARCKVDIAPFTVSGTVTAIVGTNNDQFDSTALGAQPDNWFQFGQFTWTTGENVNVAPFNKAKAHTQEGSAGRITLAFPAPRTIQIGDGFDIVAGCNLQFSTCRDKFNNVPNHRGFPHVPGQNAILKTGGQ